MHLMHEAIASLREKGVEVTEIEETASMAAILLHDVGHGPFSHVMEHTLVDGITHEEISLMMMEEIKGNGYGVMDNGCGDEWAQVMDVAIRIFKDEYEKHFLHQLISSQLDVDRLDYLCRDSFFCGVTEGSVASARILKMMNVKDGKLVVEAKGIYSVEKFLVARRLMYWQVYLHHTSVAAEQLLIKILERAKHLASKGVELFCSPALRYFLYGKITAEKFAAGPEALRQYALLDDSDLLSAIKVWMSVEDVVLSRLCELFVNRQLFKGQLLEEALTETDKAALRKEYMDALGVSEEDAKFFFEEHISTSNTYSEKGEAIDILYKDGEVRDIADASDMLSMESLTFKPQKRYLFRMKL
jgi:HD superfamily phosphohydrolase